MSELFELTMTEKLSPVESDPGWVYVFGIPISVNNRSNTGSRNIGDTPGTFMEQSENSFETLQETEQTHRKSLSSRTQCNSSETGIHGTLSGDVVHDSEEETGSECPPGSVISGPRQHSYHSRNLSADYRSGSIQESGLLSDKCPLTLLRDKANSWGSLPDMDTFTGPNNNSLPRPTPLETKSYSYPALQSTESNRLTDSNRLSESVSGLECDVWSRSSHPSLISSDLTCERRPDLDQLFRWSRGIVNHGQVIKQLRREKPLNYKQKVCGLKKTLFSSIIRWRCYICHVIYTL